MERRTTLVIDDARLAAAQEVLGTSGLKDTVDRALIEIVRADRRRRLAMRLACGEGLDTAERADHRRRQGWQR